MPRSLRRAGWIVAFVAAAVGVAAWLVTAGPAPDPEPAAAAPAPEREVLRLRTEVISVRPHDPAAFTQGLVWFGGSLYESTGNYGASSLRRVDPLSGEVLDRVDLPERYFGEGLGLAAERLVQLTWQERVALVYDLGTLARVGEHGYEGEGWGLCHDGGRWVMSDGSHRLVFRDTERFAPVGGVEVTLGGRPVAGLNELECAEGWVYANVWQSDAIVRIDPLSGRVEATIDASGLLGADERAASDVLNGIAYDAAAETFLLTGKNWPKLFEVIFVRADP